VWAKCGQPDVSASFGFARPDRRASTNKPAEKQVRECPRHHKDSDLADARFRKCAWAGLCQTWPAASELSPLVLLHGLSMSDSAWRETVPLVAVHHEVFTPTAIGHRGGPPVQRRPVTIWDVIDAAERYLDEHGLERPHLAGNSMGGFSRPTVRMGWPGCHAR
jgi:pimeloyl-ACP methyl ester carboxylesterase